MSFLKRLFGGSKKAPVKQNELRGQITSEEGTAIQAGQGETRKHMEEELALDRERRGAAVAPQDAAQADSDDGLPA